MISKEVRNHLQNILQRRGQRRHLAIEQFVDSMRQHFNRQGVIIEEYKLKALKLEDNLTEVKVSTIVETNYKKKCQKLEEEAAYDKKWKTRYKRHHERQAEEIEELKKKLGIPKVPWYEQGENDPPETVN